MLRRIFGDYYSNTGWNQQSVTNHVNVWISQSVNESSRSALDCSRPSADQHSAVDWKLTQLIHLRGNAISYPSSGIIKFIVVTDRQIKLNFLFGKLK
jgi:hypothetical protein